MNKKLNNNFSLRKLLLTALVSGPLATLPAPLWALPVIDGNLTTSAGVTTQVVGSTLNVTSPDKAVLTWQAFGSGSSSIISTDIINYFLPTASSSVLNTVTGGVASTIGGQILSNGNVYILNPAGIVISQTAQINVGGFYASTVSEPSGFFGINGTLSYAGSSNSNVVVEGTGVTGGTDTAQIQAVGTGNNIYLAGQAVDVRGGKFFGNLFVRASNASGTIAGMDGNNVRFGETGPVSINLVGAALTGGGLNITSNGGNVKLTGGTQATLTGALASTPAGTLTSIALGTAAGAYNAPPIVTISPPSSSTYSIATATAPLNTSGVPVPTVSGTGNSGGSGYAANSTTIPVTTVGGTTTGTAAVFTANTNASGVITSFNTVKAGKDYTVAPTLIIAPPAGVVPATAIARVNSSGVIESFTITNPGAGYTAAPTVTVTSPSVATVQTHVPVLTADFISNIPVTAGTLGYLPSPAVTITPVGAGSGAAATAIINTSGAITGYAITNAGTGYTTAPTVSVATGTGGGVAVPGAAGITLAGVALAAVTGASSGSNYGTTIPTVTLSGGGGTGAIATATLASGVVTGYTLVSAGSGYTSAPTVTVSAPTNGSLTFAPNVASTKGALSIDTNGNGVQGSITQGVSAINASTSGQTVALNAGVGGNITLGAIDALTLGATGNNISITDTAGDLTLNATTAAGTLAVAGAGSILQGTGTHSSVGAITLTPAAGKTVAFTGTGDLTFANIASTSTITISTPGNVTFNQATLAATNGTLSITSTGGTISANAIAASSTLTISATSAAGRLTATSLRSATGNVNVTGDISGVGTGTTPITNTGGTLAITTTAGNLSLGAITASGTLNLTATAGTISAGAISSNTLNISAPLGTVTTTGILANTNTATISSGAVTLAGISSTSSLTVTATTGNLTATSISTSSTLSLNAPSVTGTILTNQILATSTQPVSLTSGGTLNIAGLGTATTPTPSATNSLVTVPTLNLTSTAGSITQPTAGVIISTGTATITPFADATLTNLDNDFNNVVLKGGASATTIGTQVTDKNAINIANGTTALGNVTITAGARIAAYTANPTITIASPLATAAATAKINTASGALSELAATVTSSVSQNGGGYINAPFVSIAAPTNPANPVGLVRATATATINPLTGLVTGYTITNVGAGYTAAPTVTIGNAVAQGSTTNAQGTLNILAAGVAVASGGALSAVNVTTAGTAPYSAAPTVTIEGTTAGASATASINALGTVSVTPTHSGSITLGNAAVDVLSFAQNLTLTTGGIAGKVVGTTTPIYSGLTTPANSVSVLGNVSLNSSKGTAFTLGSTTFGTAANYNFGQISAELSTGALTINETQTVNLGTITAGSLDARSVNGNIVNTGKLAVTGNTVLAANSIFNPGDVTLNFATNAISGPVLIGNARDFSLTNNGITTVTAGTPLVNGKAATGAVNVTVTGGTLTLGTANGGDFSTVGFNTTGTVTITDPNGITLQNATNTGAGNVTVTAAGPIVLGSGIALNSTGVTAITSTGASASITDSTPGIRIVGNVNLTSDAQIAITQAGHSLGAVGLVTTGKLTGALDPANTATASANITYTEGGTANLNGVSVNSSGLATAGGVLNVVSTGGSIIQKSTTGSIILTPTAGVAAGSATFTSVGDVTLNNPAGTNNIAGPIVISAVGNASIAQGQDITLGNTTVSAGTFSADSSSSAGKTITQAAGTTAKIYGASTFTTQNGKITLTNTDGTGNNFGAVSARTTLANGAEFSVGTATGALAGQQATATGGLAGTVPTIALATGTGTGGSGYVANSTTIVVTTSAPPATGTAAVFTANTNASGVITGFNTVTAGSGYTAAPTITISAPGGTATVPAITVATGGGGYAPNLTNIAVTTVGGTTTGTPAVFTANTNSVGVITGFTTVTAGTGYTVAPSFTIAAPVAATGADIAITEGGTLNFAQVKAGPAGKLTAISTGGDIIQTTTGGVQVGGATALTSSSNVTLNVVGAANSFGGNAGIAITAPGNVSLQDAAATTALAGGSTIGGALTLKNTFGGGAIRDLSGTIAVAGSTWFDTGTTGSVNIGNSSITLGAVKFNSGTVTIVENATLDIAPGSVANGAVSLTSSGNIITSGTGGSGFQSTLTLSATGSIAITNPIFVVGAGTTGLVFRALGTVNLGVLSLSGNLNGIAPTNLGASTYTPPAP